MDITDQQLCEAMALLDLHPEEFLAARKAPSEKPLKDLKRKAKRAYRKLALKYHPDRNGGDEEKTFMFQVASEVLAEVQDLRYIPPRPSFTIKFKIMGRPI